MRNLITILSLICISIAAGAENKPIEVKTQKGVTRLTFMSPRIVRVEKAQTSPKESRSLVVTMKADKGMKLKVSESASKTTAASNAMEVSVDKQTGLVSFSAKGMNLVKEKAYEVGKRPSVMYLLDKNEPIYGLGTLQDGKMNRRGTEKKMMEQSNLEDFQYVVQSLKGWGIYWDTYARADFIDNSDGMTFSPEVGDKIDYYLMYGGSADGVNQRMRELSGGVPMFPLWTFGYWQCRERYKSARELLEVVDWHRKNQVPLDGIIQDWQYWGSNYLWNAMEFLNDEFSDGSGMIRRVHEQNAHLMISIWQSFGPKTKQYRELEKQGLLYDFETWPQSGSSIWPPKREYPSGVRVYDAYSQEAKDIYWKYLSELHRQGVDAWWMDSTDPDYMSPKDEDYNREVGQSPSRGIGAQGTWRTMRNAYPLACVSGVYDHQREADKEHRVFIMTRSAFAGQQRYGSGLWSGDVTSSWDVLRKQIPLGLNYTMTGCPNFNTDIGGFFCGRYGGGNAPKNPNYQELYVRWLQYGLFCPVFRSHGADAPREIYQFGKKGEPVFNAIEESIHLRYRLLPYIYSTAWAVTHDGESYLRALVYDFAQDERTWDIGDEFMFGRSILALPITRPQYTNEDTRAMANVDFTQSREATKYLPKGTDWYDFWTEKRYQGGQDVSIPTPFHQAPMMIRAGSVLPLTSVSQYASEKKWDNLELVIYRGSNGQFTLYEDEGDSYRYEEGQYSTINLQWNEKKGELIIGKRKGSFPGMLEKRTFNIRTAGQQNVRKVEYNGNEIRIKI